MALLDTIVLISPDGMLGRAWVDLLTRRGLSFSTLTYPTFDMTSREHVQQGVRAGTSLVINCAAWTDVDGAEAREAEATRVNGDAVGYLAQRCAEVGATLAHYSTDYVFNGHATTPYRVDQTREPLNAYGRGKAVGEIRVVESGCAHMIVRTSWLYASWGTNFVRTIAKAARERPSLRVVSDQRGRPTSATHLASMTLAMLERGAKGIHHITDGGECTWFEFAQVIAAHANPSCTVDPCSSAEFSRPAVRPPYSVLDLSATEALVGKMPSWRDNLAQVLAQIDRPA